MLQVPKVEHATRGTMMQVYEHNDPDSLRPRTHPWTDGESDPAHKYYDFRARPELIRSSIEDLQEWEAYPATETFYRLLEWLNGPESALESNDCAFSGATANTSSARSKHSAVFRPPDDSLPGPGIEYLTGTDALVDQRHRSRDERCRSGIRMGCRRCHHHLGQIYDPAWSSGTATGTATHVVVLGLGRR